MESLTILVSLVVGSFLSFKIMKFCVVAAALNNRKNSAIRKIRKLVELHQATLAKKRYQLVRTDDYGIVKGDRWNVEIQYFMNNVIIPSLTEEECDAIREDISAIGQAEIEDVIRPLSSQLSKNLDFNREMTPAEFEHYVATQFRKAGWQANVSKGSGDQGADVLARKPDCSAAVQCKLYGRPVGNKAVQEVIAAREYYQTDRAYVVTNSSYTKSAEKLAAASNVVLLHYSDLAGDLI